MAYLSRIGEEAHFPSSGILAQTAAAFGTEYNATIGQAFADNGSPLLLPSLKGNVDGDWFLYTSSYGNKNLRSSWFKEGSLPVVVNGITHGLYIVGQMFLDSEDKLIIPDLMWENYKLVFKHASLETFETFSSGGFNVAGLRDKLVGTDKKVVLLNFPNNPTGYTPTDSEVEKIVSVLKEASLRCEVVVILDDAYAGLVYENGFKGSLFSKLVDSNLVVVKIDGITKEMYAWGLRVGFVTYGGTGLNYKELENKTAGIIRGSISNVCTISQQMALNCLESSSFSLEKEKNYLILKERYFKVKEMIARYSLEALPFNSGYFMCVRVVDAENVRLQLLKEGVGVIRVGDDLLRIAYSSVGLDKIEKLFEKISDKIKKYGPAEI